MNKPWYKSNIFVSAVVLVIIIIVLLLAKNGTSMIGGNQPVDLTDKIAAKPATGEVVMTGKLNCLPFRNGQEVTEDNCVIGLIADDGQAYALDTLTISILSKTLEPQDEARVVGKLDVPNENASENAFSIAGIIHVRALQRADIPTASSTPAM